MTHDRQPSNTLYAAIHRRDPALDGKVFCAIRTTGIYCRPVCRARMPLQRNILLYPSAAAAEAAGFRPCLRCRPESAPFSPAWKGTGATVERALKLIDAGALDMGSVTQLATRLGIGERHLSRLFADTLGTTPLQVAKTQRIQRAKRLLDNDTAPLEEIARRAGFGSARRMRAAFVELYGRPPSQMPSRR